MSVFEHFFSSSFSLGSKAKWFLFSIFLFCWKSGSVISSYDKHYLQFYNIYAMSALGCQNRGRPSVVVIVPIERIYYLYCLLLTALEPHHWCRVHLLVFVRSIPLKCVKRDRGTWSKKNQKNFSNSLKTNIEKLQNIKQ